MTALLLAVAVIRAQLLAGKDWTPHKIQGWTPDFVPKVLNKDVADEIVPVTIPSMS